MQRKRYYYLINLQYLGFRYHGWQKQPDVNTAQRMVERTLAYILDRKNFKTLAAGRTDAMVSVENTYIELFLDETPIENLDDFLILFNKNLPQDIRALGIEETDAKFNIIQHPKTKEYRYLFAFGSKHHPFAAPYMTNILEDLDIELMQQGAKCFEGSHYFKAYTFRPTPTMQFNGTIDTCEIIENTEFTASFFPEKSYCLRICGQGFKRHQIRMMMGVLILLGKKEVTLDFIKASLLPDAKQEVTFIAPASGLMLYQISL